MSITTDLDRESVLAEFKENPLLFSQEMPVWGKVGFGWTDLDTTNPKIRMKIPVIFRFWQGNVKMENENNKLKINLIIVPGIVLIAFFALAFSMIIHSIFTLSFSYLGTDKFIPSLSINLIGIVLFAGMGTFIMWRTAKQVKKLIEKRLAKVAK